MKAKWLNRYNEETKQTEQFYPITHVNAVIDLNQNDLINTEPVGSVEEDDEATVSPIIEDRFAALEQKVTNVEDELNTLAGVSVTLESMGVTATATELNYMDGVTSAVQTQLNSKLGKTTYEYNMELSMGGSGYVCIGKFPMYDSNVSVEIKSTTNTTYHGTLIIASQNINTTGGGTYTAKVYGDADNSLTGSIKIHYGSGSNVFSVYAALPTWSKNLLHIQCANLPSAPSDIATSVSSIPSNATIVPTNALKVQLDTKANKSDIPTLSSLGVTATANELNYVDGVTSNIQTQFNAVTDRLADLEAVADALAQI